MSCIHYKFRSALEYDTITFDGLSISLADLKRSIITQKKFGKNSDFDLEVTNAQTKEGELLFFHVFFLGWSPFVKTVCLDVCVAELHGKNCRLLLFLLKSSKVPALACFLFFIEFDDVLESND